MLKDILKGKSTIEIYDAVLEMEPNKNFFRGILRDQPHIFRAAVYHFEKIGGDIDIINSAEAVVQQGRSHLYFKEEEGAESFLWLAKIAGVEEELKVDAVQINARAHAFASDQYGYCVMTKRYYDGKYTL